MPTAFLRKSFKTVCVDTVLFFAMFALVGHITINYWERYTIQNELYSMKHSLHTLKDTIGNIGIAYDNLHTKLKDLLFEVEKKQIHHKDTPECRHKEKLEARCKAENQLNKKRRDFEVQTVLTTNKIKIGVGVETNNKKKPNARKNKATGPSGINASTNTKNPPKSTGTTSDIPNEEDSREEDEDSRGVETNNKKKPNARKNKATGPSGINASTNTKNPPKSTGTTSDIPNEEDYLRCQKNFENCKHVCHDGGATDKNHK